MAKPASHLTFFLMVTIHSLNSTLHRMAVAGFR